jgi:hypothetical protein
MTSNLLFSRLRPVERTLQKWKFPFLWAFFSLLDLDTRIQLNSGCCTAILEVPKLDSSANLLTYFTILVQFNPLICHRRAKWLVDCAGLRDRVPAKIRTVWTESADRSATVHGGGNFPHQLRHLHVSCFSMLGTKQLRHSVTYTVPYTVPVSFNLKERKKERKKERIFIYLSQCTQQFHYIVHFRFHMF